MALTKIVNGMLTGGDIPEGTEVGQQMLLCNFTSSQQAISSNSLLQVPSTITLDPGETLQFTWTGHKWLSAYKSPSNSENAIITYLEVGDSPDHTTVLQTALDGAGHIYLGPGTWFVSGSLTFSSNTRLQLHPDAIIQRLLTMPEFTIALKVPWNTTNVIIEGGQLDGNKQSPTIGAGGRCMGIGILGALDVIVRDMIIYDWPADESGGSYGYGMYLGAGGNDEPNQRVTVQNVHIYGCEQNNAFLVTGRNILFDNCKFFDSPGDTPGSGLDIEPNLTEEVVQNVTVRKCVFSGNSVGVTCNNHYNGYWHDITFDDCRFHGNREFGLFCTGADLAEGTFKIINCKFTNNGNSGCYAAAINGLRITDCRADGNEGYGFELFAPRDFTVSGCQAHNNTSYGLFLREDDNEPSHGLIVGSSFFNNGTYGLSIGKSVVSGNVLSGVHVAFCRFGNNNNYKYAAWTASKDVVPDYRVLNDSGKIYECITAGTTAGSGGPTGTAADITDGTAHWKYVAAQPVQTWGVSIDGEDARGTILTRNYYDGNTVGRIREFPTGDANALFTADILESQADGQAMSPLTRSRSVAFEDKSGTPGDVTTYYAAGIAAIAGSGTTCTVTTPFCDSQDMVRITPLDIDANITKFKAVAGAGSFVVTVNTAAAATWKFSWEIIKKGTFTYDL